MGVASVFVLHLLENLTFIIIDAFDQQTLCDCTSVSLSSSVASEPLMTAGVYP